MVITIVGLGVVGGSYALALKGKIYGAEINAIDIKEDTLEKAKEMEIVKNGFLYKSEESKRLIKNTDLLIICLYPKSIKEFISIYSPCFKEELLITDTTGIKEGFMDEVLKDLPKKIDFVFAHPMAGREKKGLEYASRKVLIGANFVITPIERNKEENLKRIEELAKTMGFGKIARVAPRDHDKIIGFTSQLPHAIAVSLINSDNNNMETGDFIGDSYRDLTRIANINEDLWSELFIGNKNNLLKSIDNFQNELSRIKEAIEGENINTLRQCFLDAALRREKL